MQTLRRAVMCLINQQRTSRGLPALRESPLLDRSAQGWTDVMVASGIFTHGANFAARITAAGFAWSSAGENIATGFGTPRAVVLAWMRSADHCQNILSPYFRDVGIGANGRPVPGWATRPATWTEDFALPAGERPPSGNWGPASHCPY
jgi:uncharacterized protein YkwD